MNAVKLTAKILFALIFISLAACSERQEKTTKDFYGYIESTQINVTTRIPGKITDIYVDEGDYVKEDDTVAQLDTKELEAHRQALLARLKNIKINRKRVLNLYNAGAVPKQKVDEIETNYEIVKDNLIALESKLHDMTIRAPIDGVVNVRVLEVGQMMPPGMPVVIVTDTSATYARFSVPESYLNQLDLGKEVNLKTVNGDETIKAKVIQIVPVADFATHTPTTASDERDVRSFTVKMKIVDDAKNLKPGMSVYLTLKIPKRGESNNG